MSLFGNLFKKAGKKSKKTAMNGVRRANVPRVEVDRIVVDQFEPLKFEPKRFEPETVKIGFDKDWKTATFRDTVTGDIYEVVFGDDEAFGKFMSDKNMHLVIK